MSKICINTFGCQMNKLDSELVAEALTADGHTITAFEKEADVILFNTCSVRDHAEQRVISRIQQLKQMKKRKPSLIIGIMGCFAQRKGAELFDILPHLDLVCGTRQFPNICALIERAASGHVIETKESSLTAPGTLDAHGRPLHSGIQAYISIMRGCNNFCTYCIVPYVRGREESRPIDAIVKETKTLVGRGAKEITLLGQNVDAYGKDIGTDLSELLKEIHDIKGITRIRFVTSHPRDITEKLLLTVSNLPKVCNHLHMPAQSGSTRILQAMNRGYTREEYDVKLRMVNNIIPEMLVTSDFIVGFPGETDDDFNATLELITEANFQNSYIFKYSPRPGTKAAKIEDSVPLEVKKARNQILLASQEKVNIRRAENMIGSVQEIMVEGISPRDERKMIGRTQSNLICVFDKQDDPDSLIGELINLEIESNTALTLFGKRITQ